MKTAAALLLLAASADGAAHSIHCATGCEKHDCAGKGLDDMVAEFDKVKLANTGNGTGKDSLHKPVANSTAVAVHEPAFCKVTDSGRRLAAHAAAHLRVYVAYTGLPKLHPMKEAHHIDYIQVIDASKGSHARRLAGHKATMLYGKTWKADSVKADHPNAGFDFTILKADEVTHVEAVEHCNIHGLWWSKRYKVSDIPDCVSGMNSDQDPAGRRLAAHAGKFTEIKNFDGEASGKCPVKDDADASSRATIAGGIVAAAAAMVAGLFF